MKKIIAISLVALFTIGATFSFANASENLKREFKFTAKTEENLDYDVPKEVKENGKVYKLIESRDTEYKVLKTNKVAVTKTVFSDKKTDEGVIKEIQENNITLTLKNIDWKDNDSKVTGEKTYDSESKITDTIKGVKTVDEKEVDVVLRKDSVSKFITPQNFTAPAVFTGHPDSPYYTFNAKQIELKTGEPKWNAWEKDVADYLGINNSEYKINGISWQGNFEDLGNSKYKRIATVSGIRYVPGWRVNYTEEGAEYKGIATYEGIDGNKKVEAVATAYYTQELSLLQKVIVTIAGLLILALIIGILIYLRKNRKRGE